MTQEESLVKITLQTTIHDGPHQEIVQTEHRGKFYRRKLRDVLLFDEQTDEGLSINNFLVLQENQASIKRSGQVSMHQRFSVGQRDETVYEHPHGTFHMETFTKKLKYERLDENRSGKLTIDYTVSLNGQEERRHQLVLTYKEDM